jgi:hypothetical protein
LFKNGLRGCVNRLGGIGVWWSTEKVLVRGSADVAVEEGGKKDCAADAGADGGGGG